MELNKKRIFITGGAGFIGSNLVARLKKQNKITVYDKKNGDDLLDFIKLKKAIKNHDFVFHLASNPDIAKSEKNPRLDIDQGILTAFNVLEAMRLNDIKKIAYTSGSGVYGDQGVKYTKESFGPLLPVSMYGASKLACEGLVSAFCHMYNMQAWIFRPANIVGKGQTHGVGYDFIKKLRNNPRELTILGDGTQSKSYLYINDLIEAVLLAIKKANDEVNLFNLASNGFTDVNTIAKITVKEMGLKNVKFNYTGGSRGWKGDVPKVRLDVAKIKKLGWQAKLNSNQAIRQSIKDLLK
ncbi:MAG: NAD-dependent epimerase/dehydratase family protein [Candidatus Nealsonbacteria bacterium]|nr:NAD-dependent epimerase/dehydratase family protein [Candidatus Nealsonbacteria bacterium]